MYFVVRLCDHEYAYTRKSVKHKDVWLRLRYDMLPLLVQEPSRSDYLILTFDLLKLTIVLYCMRLTWTPRLKFVSNLAYMCIFRA